MGRGNNGNAGTRPANSTGYKSKYEGMGINVNGMTQADVSYLSKQKGKALDDALDVWKLVENKEGQHESLEKIVSAKPKAADFGFTEEQAAKVFNYTKKELKISMDYMGSTAGNYASEKIKYPIGSKEYKELDAKHKDASNTYQYVRKLKLWKSRFHLK